MGKECEKYELYERNNEKLSEILHNLQKACHINRTIEIIKGYLEKNL
jgi:hypothetical protein